MSDLSERDIVRHARRLNGVVPAADATRRAIDATAAALARRPRPVRQWWGWRMVAGLGLIAAICAAFAVAYTTLFPRANTASAAAMLQQVADANEAYRGWVHMHSEGPGERPGDPPQVGISHLNTVDGTWILDHQTKGVRRVQMWVPKTKEEYTYDLAANEIRIGDLTDSFAAEWTQQMRNYPLTLMAAQEERKKRGLPPAKIVERTEGELLRFDITMEAPATEPAATAATTAAATTKPATRPVIEKATMWADPRTKLIVKGEFQVETGKAFTVTFTYGDPEITSLYDIGVPRDAKVLDNRVKQDVAAVLDRLQGRFDKGLGDGVAFLTGVGIGADGKPNTSAGTIELFARNGDAIFAGRYLVGPPEEPNAGFKSPLPPTWPNPRVEDVLTTLRGAMPTNFVVSDGVRAWQAFGESRQQMHVRSVAPKSQDMLHMRAMFDVSGKIWPTRGGLGVFGAGSRVETRTDPARPGLLAIHVEQSIWTGQGQPNDPKNQRRTERTHWLDPARDDLPVEQSWTNYGPDGKQVELQSKISYHDARQLPGGQWYPSRWRARVTGSMMAREQHEEFTLHVFPGHPIDKEWFTNPVERLQRAPATQP